MKIAVRCDAGEKIGLGHFYRDFALALAAVEQGHEVLFAMAETNESLKTLLRGAGIDFERVPANAAGDADLRATLAILSNFDADCALLDGYRFGSVFAETIDAAAPLVMFDDLGDFDGDVSVVLNVNVYANDIKYRVPDRTRVLTGIEYALLRPQFRRLRPDQPRAVDSIERVFVSMGGGDAGGAIRNVIESLKNVHEVELEIMIGASYTHNAKLEDAASAHPQMRIHQNLRDPARVMNRCDLAIVNAGGTTWEIACLGIPMMHIVNADNQKRIAEKCDQLGVSIFLGHADSVTGEALLRRFEGLQSNPAQLTKMSRRAWNLVDGRGTLRVLNALEELKR